MLKLDFDARGQLTNIVRVSTSSPPGVFDEAATPRPSVTCRWTPATFQGKAVPVNGVEIRIPFDLSREP